MQCGDVARTDQPSRTGSLHPLPVKEVNQPTGTVATTSAENCFDARIAPGVLEITSAIGVCPGKHSVVRTVDDMRHDLDGKPPRVQGLHTSGQPIADYGSARGHNRDPVSTMQ
jgi:hypothetical protein